MRKITVLFALLLSFVGLKAQDLPKFSTDARETWFLIEFQRGGLVLQDMGENQPIRIKNYSIDLIPEQQWKFVGDKDNFELINKKTNRHIYLDGQVFKTKSNVQGHLNFKLSKVQKEAWEIGAANSNGQTMNQFQGSRDGNEVHTWNSDSGNPLVFIKPFIFSKAGEEPTYYYIQFKSGKGVLQDKGDNQNIRTEKLARNDAQLWRLEGENLHNFELINKESGRKIYFDANRFKTGSRNGKLTIKPTAVRAYMPAWEIGAENTGGQTMNQNGGQGVDKEIGKWSSDPGNPLELISQQDMFGLKIEQETAFVGRGSEATIFTIKNIESGIKLKSLKMSMAGTTDIDNVSAIKLILIDSKGNRREVSSLAPQEGEFTISLNELATDAEGVSQLLINYVVKDNAPEGNYLDAQIFNLISSVETTDFSIKGNPEGARQIILTSVCLFAPGDNGSKNYRIPAVITAKDGSIVAIADKRKYNEKDLPEDIDIVVRRSTDMGQTWSAPLTIAEGKGRGKGFGDAGIVMAQDGTLITIFAGGNGLHGNNDNIGRTYIAKSVDNGVSWTAPIDITDQLYGPNCPTNEYDRQKWVGVFCASGNGLCTRSGRIMFVGGGKPQNGSFDNYLFYSDDNGLTWKISGKAKVGGDEAKVTELSNGDLLMSIRHGGWHSGSKPRIYTISKDGGQTWSEPARWTDMLEPACNGDMLYYTSKQDGYERNRLLHSVPHTTGILRENVSIFISYNEGESWSNPYLVVKGSSAYSSLCKLKDGTIGMFVEQNTQGEEANYSLYFLRFSLDWLTKGKDHYNAPNSGIKPLEEPRANLQGGEIYEEEAVLELTHKDKDVKIYYTLDGTAPTEESPVYMQPITLRKNTTIRAFVSKEGSVPSDIIRLEIRVRPIDEKPTALTSLEQEAVKVYVAQDGVHLEGIEQAGVKVYNLSGQVVRSFKLNGSFVQPLNLPKGIYLLKVQTAQGNKVYKLSL